VVDAAAVANLREQEKLQGLDAGGLGNKGVIYVVAKADFIAEFNAKDDSVVPEAKGEAELSFDTIPAISTEPANPEQ